MPTVVYEDDKGKKKERHFKYTQEGMKRALKFLESLDEEANGRIEYGSNSSGRNHRGTRQYA